METISQYFIRTIVNHLSSISNHSYINLYLYQDDNVYRLRVVHLHLANDIGISSIEGVIKCQALHVNNALSFKGASFT